MSKIGNVIKKTKNYYQYYGFKRTGGAVLYQVKIRLFKGKIYINATEKYKNFDLNTDEKFEDCIYKNKKNIFIFFHIWKYNLFTISFD